MNKILFTAKEIENGKIEGIDKGLFTTQLLNNLRATRKINYTKIGGKCYYKKEWLEKYIENNNVKTKIKLSSS